MIDSRLKEEIPFRKMISMLCSKCFGMINQIIDEQPGTITQKEELQQLLYHIHLLVAKTLITYRFNQKYSELSQVMEYLSSTSAYEDYLVDFGLSLAKAYYLGVNTLRTPYYDVPAAIDLLVGRGLSRLPLSLFPFEEQNKEIMDKNRFLKFCEDILKFYMTNCTIPEGIILSFSSGCAIIENPQKYRLKVSLSEIDSPIEVAELVFLIPQFRLYDLETIQTHELGDIYIYQETLSEIKNHINIVFQQKQHDDFIKVNDILISFCILFDLQRIKREASNYQSILSTTLDVVSRSIFIKYWENEIKIIHKGTTLETYYGNENQGNSYGKSFDTIIFEFRKWYSNKELAKIQKEIGWDLKTDPSGAPILEFGSSRIYINKFSGLPFVKFRDEEPQQILPPLIDIFKNRALLEYEKRSNIEQFKFW